MANKLNREEPLRIGINGFGRIGRCVLRVLSQLPVFKDKVVEVVSINDLTDAKMLAHLFKYDSVHGTYPGEVSADGNTLSINGIKIPVTSQPDPAKLAWGDKKTDIILECTGRLKNREAAAAHLSAGAKKVIISAPMNDSDLTIVCGVNDDQYDNAKHQIVSNASCTTNCLAPVVKVLDHQFKVKRGVMTTIHSYTNDQRILDLPHSDPRRARAAAVSMIPTTTGAAKAVGLVLPHLKGKLDGMSIRVPTPNVSVVDVTCEFENSATVEEVNAALKAAAEGELKDILAYTDEPLVSCDFRGNPNSSIVDGAMTSVVEGTMVKVLSWYDNEWGFSNRMVQLAFKMGSQL